MAENETNNSSNNASAALPARPLFAAASKFPSANIVRDNASQTRTGSQDSESKENNDLSSLKLQLNPATLAAIIAVQKPDNDLSQQSLSLESVQGAISYESLQGENKSHKRKQEDSDNDDVKQSVSPKRKKHHKKKKHKHKKKSHSKSLESKESLMLNPPDIPKHAIFLDDIKDINQKPAYKLDKIANKDLWHYKSVSKLHISRYKPRIFNCLGASHIFIKDLRNEKKGKIKEGLPRYFQKGFLKHIHMKGLEFRSSGNKESKYSSGDFIAIFKEDSKRDDKSHVIGNYSCLDDATSSYVQGKHADYSKQPETQSEDLVMDEIFEKVRRYNERTRDEPHNVQLWLEFVQFQDVVAQEDKSFKGQTIHLRERYQPSKSVIEKKLAILDKALEKNPSSLELKLTQLQLYQDIWESDKLEKAWGDLLFVHSASVDLWQHYVSKQQSRLFKFSFSRILKCYHKAFKTLVPILDGQVNALNKKEDMEEKLLGLFCQYCSFLHQTGYTERAVSSYQAMIEFNLLCPAQLRINTTQDRMKQFEEFWDSSAPRFGEDKAKGWREWSESRHTLGVSSNSESTQEQEDAVVSERLSRSQKWLKMENIRQNVHWLPWRPDNEKGETLESCEDLDRVVLFEDISPAVFRITKLESHIRIVCLFLKFLGVSSDVLEKALVEVSGTASICGRFDQYSSISVAQFPFLTPIKCGIEVDSAWKPHACLATFISEVLVQAETLLSLSNRAVFTRLRLELEVLKLGVFSVSELSKSDVKKAKRFGKSLLKENQNRSNLVVWDFYIRFLWACSDNMEETVSMLDTALAMFMGSFTLSDLNKALGLCSLCRTYCQIMLNFEPLEHIKAAGRRSVPSIEDKHQVIACLGALVENKGFKPGSKSQISPAYVLKIRNRFHANMTDICNKVEQSLEPLLCDFIIAFTDCFALFEYCASGFKVVDQIYISARENVKKYSQSTVQKDHLLNSLFQQLYSAHLSLCINVMRISFTPLSETRHVLTQALQEFPDCPQFHALFLEIESGSHIAGRLRRYYEKALRNMTSLTAPLFAVLSELSRHHTVRGQELADFQQIDTGVVHRVRSVFEHCLQEDVSSHCPLLWRLFLMFEAKYGSQSRAKGIFYRALQSCPWAKCIYMNGIAIFGDSELQEVMDLMTEEEIRIRMPLEELDLLLTAENDVDGIKDEECSSDHAAYVDSENAERGTVSSNTGIHNT